MNRLVRRFSALLAISALLFAQLAVAAYACPMDKVPERVTSTLSAGETHCNDLQSPNLCDGHCAYGSSVAGHATGPSSAPFIATPLSSRIEETSAAVVNARAFDEDFLRFEPPPPLTLFGVLRI
jgi:hypothetical protein